MKRRGFTLIELMVVIAIIIILAAVAIPNYLNMTARAKKSRISSDFASLATALESYNTDWGHYPAVTTAGTVVALKPGSIVYGELSGTAGASVNIAGATTTTGEGGPIVYIQKQTLDQMTNPLATSTDDAQKYYQYNTVAADASAPKSWVLYAFDGTNYYFRTTTNTNLRQVSSAAPTPSS